MKQPIITRDLERKAIYTDILYDPEWLYISINLGRAIFTRGVRFDLNLKDTRRDFVIDWGDGNIEKNVASHWYDKGGTYTVRIKGYIYYVGKPDNVHRLFSLGECV